MGGFKMSSNFRKFRSYLKKEAEVEWTKKDNVMLIIDDEEEEKEQGTKKVKLD